MLFFKDEEDSSDGAMVWFRALRVPVDLAVSPWHAPQLTWKERAKRLSGLQAGLVVGRQTQVPRKGGHCCRPPVCAETSAAVHGRTKKNLGS